MTPNLTNVIVKHFNLLVTVLNFPRKIVAENSVTKNPEFMPQNSENNEPSCSHFCNKNQLRITEPENNITLPSPYLHNTKKSTANFSLDNKQITTSIMTQHSDLTPPTFLKTTLHP